MSDELQFKISSALKNVIGSDLINDDFIAIFELVKNAYDAHATRVDVIFSNLYSKNAKILIKDNGKGMDYNDLIEKWLFVAYSAKKDETEEDSYDFRDKIKVKRAYAGAKGIGRFSCDRLGRNLYLETIKDKLNPKVEVLITDWDKFDVNGKDEFINISVIHDTLPESSYGITNGTVLEISDLKSSWDRTKLLNLKDALAKLINPDAKNIQNDFEIYLSVEAEKKNDSKESVYHKIVNGKIRNIIFEALELKTTKLVSKISEINPEIIETSLFEGGKLVYKIEEESQFKHLHGIESEIYYLNRSAKMTFSRRMGLQPVEYGHIFVYKNGLRIFPYGERGEDPLKMDNRKAQGRTRYLGTREVIGYIKIVGKNPDLSETSSRGEGLSKTETYFELIEWFYQSIKRIEKYIIDIVDWGNFLSPEDYINFDNFFVKGDIDKGNLEIKDVNENLKKLIDSLANTKNLISLEVAPNILQIIDEKSSNSVETQLSGIKEKIDSGNFDKNEILKDIETAGRKLQDLKNQKDEAEIEAGLLRAENENIDSELINERQKASYLLATRKTLSEDADGLIHTIKINSIEIKESTDILLQLLEEPEIDVERFRAKLGYIMINAERSLKMTEFVTRTDFNEDIEKRSVDVVRFIQEYIDLYHNIYEDKLEFSIVTNNIRFIKNLSVLNLSIVLDNLISNSLKWQSSKIKISFNLINDKELSLKYYDNGLGLSPRFLKNPNQIFDLSIREKSPEGSGSGIGLYYSEDLLKKMGAQIKFIGNNLDLKGASFEIIFKSI